MPYCKSDVVVTPSNSPDFAMKFPAGGRAQFAGIYQCDACSRYEIACAVDEILPMVDSIHDTYGCDARFLKWQLIVRPLQQKRGA
jgi:hypothetical protein